MPFQKEIANITPAKGGILMFCKESLWQNHIADSRDEGTAITEIKSLVCLFFFPKSAVNSF